MYYVYILRNSLSRLYIGQTNNLAQRLVAHEHGAVRFTRTSNKFELVYYEMFETRLESMGREKQLKGWTRIKKEALIVNDLNLLKKL